MCLTTAAFHGKVEMKETATAVGLASKMYVCIVPLLNVKEKKAYMGAGMGRRKRCRFKSGRRPTVLSFTRRRFIPTAVLNVCFYKLFT